MKRNQISRLERLPQRSRSLLPQRVNSARDPVQKAVGEPGPDLDSDLHQLFERKLGQELEQLEKRMESSESQQEKCTVLCQQEQLVTPRLSHLLCHRCYHMKDQCFVLEQDNRVVYRQALQPHETTSFTISICNQ